MSIGTIRGAVAAWPTVAEGKLKKLGKAGAFEYATYKDAEYAITIRPFAPEQTSPGPGEVLIVEDVEEIVDGTRWGSTIHRRAFPVALGTYAREQAKRDRRRPTDHPMRRWDVLAAAVPSLHRKDPLRIVTEPGADPLLGRLRTWTTKAKASPVVEVGGSAGVERTPAGYIAWLASSGIELVVANGRLVARSVRPIHAEERTLIELAEELLIGELTGKPVPCSLCESPAVTVALPNAPVCAEHAGPDR